MCVAELPGAKPVRISFLRNAETLHGFDESCLFEARNEIRSSGMFQLKDHFGAFAPNSFFSISTKLRADETTQILFEFRNFSINPQMFVFDLCFALRN